MCENNKTSLKALPGEPILKLWSLTCKNNNKPFEALPGDAILRVGAQRAKTIKGHFMYCLGKQF